MRVQGEITETYNENLTRSSGGRVFVEEEMLRKNIAFNLSSILSFTLFYQQIQILKLGSRHIVILNCLSHT